MIHVRKEHDLFSSLCGSIGAIASDHRPVPPGQECADCERLAVLYAEERKRLFDERFERMQAEEAEERAKIERRAEELRRSADAYWQELKVKYYRERDGIAAREAELIAIGERRGLEKAAKMAEQAAATIDAWLRGELSRKASMYLLSEMCREADAFEAYAKRIAALIVPATSGGRP